MESNELLLNKNDLRDRAEFALSNDKKPRIMGVVRYSTIDDFLNQFEKTDGYHGKRNDDWKFGNVPKEEQYTKKGNQYWVSREEVTDKYLLNGDIMDDVIEHIEDYKEKLELSGANQLHGQFKSCVRKRRFTDDGAEINIDRALSGEPEFWESHKRDGKKEFITIAVQLSLSAGNGLKSFAKNMALAYCVCEILENLGYGVSIDCLSSCHNQLQPIHARRHHKEKLEEIGVDFDDNQWNSKYFSYPETGDIFRIKDSDERTDVRNLACTALPSLLRKYMFHIDEIIFGYDGGSALETSQDYLNFVGVDMLIAKQWSNDNQFERVVQTIKSLIEK